MSKRRNVYPSVPQQATPEHKMAMKHLASESTFDPETYLFDDRFKPGNPSDFRSVHTISEIMACLEQNKDIEAEGIFLEANTTGQYRYRRINGRESIQEVWKKNSRLKKFREFDSFANDGAGANAGLVGDDYVPLLSGPFNKQPYLYDYLRAHALCFHEYHHHPFAKAIVSITRDFVLGRGYRIDSEDLKALALWRAFEEVNDLQAMMEDIVKEGSIYGENMIWWIPDQSTFISYQDAPGQEPARGLIPRIRLIDPSTCWEIVTFPEDIKRVLFYQLIFPCLHGDTKIALLDGTDVAIKDLAARWEKDKKPIGVYSFNIEKKRVEAGWAHSVMATGIKRCVKIKLDNDEEVIASYDHPFLTRKGEYVWAENLASGDSLAPLYKDVGKNGYPRVYQPEIKKTQYTHHMVAESLLGGRVGKVVHHKDHNKLNNDPNNLEVIEDSDHRKNHGKANWENPAYIEKCSAARDIVMQSDDYKIKMAETMRKRWENPEYKERVSASQLKRWAKTKEAKFANNHKVISVEPAGDHLVYDMTVDGNHNFALSAGVFTHNTQYQIFTGKSAGSSVPTSKFIMQQLPAQDVMHFKYNSVSNEKRGRSDLFPVLGYLKWVRDVVNYKLIALKKQSAWTEDIVVEGSQTDVDNLAASMAALGSFEPAGSRFIHTDKITRQYMANQGTGSDDATLEWGVSMIAAGSQIPVSYFGLTGSTHATRASAIVGTEPVAKKFERRQRELTRMLQAIWRRFQDRHGVKGAECTITFPEIITQDRTAKLKDIKFSEDCGWISRSTAAPIAAKELDVDNYDYDEEKSKIDAEDPGIVDPTIVSPLTAPPAAPAGAPTDSTQNKTAITSDDRRKVSMSRG